ncbi:prepilin-type N-terminal cleavage/methylation domain-containing protein [Planctomycetota bacterium]
MMGKLNKGLTFVEVMVALVIALVIAIGMMSYQYAGAVNARKADMRSTANRLGLLVLDSWKSAKNSYPFNPIDYEPDDFLKGCGLGLAPLGYYDDLGTDELGLPGLSTPFKSYKVFVNGTWYWVRLTYEDTWPEGGGLPLMPMRQLNAVVAWSDDVTNEDEINYDPMRSIILSKYTTVVQE